jgi:hypothetical protein
MSEIAPAERGDSAKRRSFRNFLRNSGERNVFRVFLLWQKSVDSGRTYQWWAKRWGRDYSIVAMWAQPFQKVYRRIGPDNLHIFDDLRDLAGVTMDDYYRNLPASRQADEATKKRTPRRPPSTK